MHLAVGLAVMPGDIAAGIWIVAAHREAELDQAGFDKRGHIRRAAGAVTVAQNHVDRL